MQIFFSEFPVLFIVFVFLLALLIGSFLNVVIYRLPIMMEREWREQCDELASMPAKDLPEGRFDLVMPRSGCPSCGAQITALQNIPVFSYLLLGGKCAHCRAAIPKRYPVIELVTATMTAIVGWRFGFGWEAGAAILMTWTLIAISVIDIDHQIIPDSISLPLLWGGLLMSLFYPLQGAEILFVDPKTSIVGAIAGYLTLWSIYHLFRIVTGKEGMGYGDFKLLAALGAWLGWQVLPLVIFLSAVVGAGVGITLIVFKRHDRNVPMPFGPYLAAAGWIAMLYGPEIVDKYLTFMG
ncbi:MAG: prepilin peptidase [Gammaproteobacteria bacterium]|nr:prepilin peptidase [Gammaproteobacteria bacterium]